MVSGGMKLIKYLLFFFNFIFFISGIGLIIVGALVQAHIKDYVKILDSSFSSPPILCIVVGVLVTLIAFFGCCGAIKENYCMTMTFAVFITIILILELAAGIAAYVKRGDIEDLLKENSMKAIKHYDSDKYHDFKSAIDDIQLNFECCGFDGYKDYENNNETIPFTCCHKVDGKNPKEGCEKDMKNIYKVGCKDAVVKFFEKNINYIGPVAIALAVIQVLGLIFACCLAKTIKSEGMHV